MSIDYDEIKNISGEQLPVRMQYDGQILPQKAYLSISEGGVISATYSADIGNGMPADVWHNQTLRWPINCDLSGADILALVEDNLSLFERVHAGHSVEWNGSNHVGALNDDASEARDQLLEILHDEPSSVEVWDVNEWLFGMDDLPVVWPAGQTLAECVEECENAVDNNQAIDGGFEEALVARAKYNLEYGHDDDLLPHHIEELADRNVITREEADEWLKENSQ